LTVSVLVVASFAMLSQMLLAVDVNDM